MKLQIAQQPLVRAGGKNAARPELEACLKSLRKGDTLVVWRLDRLCRSLGDLIQLTNGFKSLNVEFESLTEKVETGSPTGKFSCLRCFRR